MDSISTNQECIAPYCRICYEAYQTTRNPLIVPCDCKGSLQHIHRRCLLRWALTHETSPETVCHLCSQRYRIGGTDRLESIPEDGGTYQVILQNPVALIIVAHYVSILMLNAIPKHLHKSRFAIYAGWGHACIHLLYLGLFASSMRIRNMALYTVYWIRHYAVVPVLHFILYKLYTYGYNEFGYVADLWLGAYWYAHQQVLRKINEEILQ